MQVCAARSHGTPERPTLHTVLPHPSPNSPLCRLVSQRPTRLESLSLRGFGQRDPTAPLRAALPRERVTLRVAAALGALAGTVHSTGSSFAVAAAAAGGGGATAGGCSDAGDGGPAAYGGRMLPYGGPALPYGGLVRLELVECGVEPMAGAALEQLGSLQVGAGCRVWA